MGTMESSKRLGKKARQVGRQRVIRWESTLSVHNQNTFRPPHRIRIMCLSTLPFALISSGLSLQSDRKSLATRRSSAGNTKGFKIKVSTLDGNCLFL